MPTAGGGPKGNRGTLSQNRPPAFPRQVRIGDMILTVSSQAELNEWLKEYDKLNNTPNPEDMLYTTRNKNQKWRRQNRGVTRYGTKIRLGEKMKPLNRGG